MRAYYNEIDRYCCDWLQNLMDAGHITPGTIDDRSIEDVLPEDLHGYERCHFFAGIAGWELALGWAGWRGPVWTGSCPCQPLSSAGQRKGHADKRHLWPAFQSLIAECKPPVCFGEQVASKDGREWFAAVRSDLERMGYACGGADLAAAGVGAPHIRQRLFWVADANDGRSQGYRAPDDSACIRARSGQRKGTVVERMADSKRHPGDTGRVAIGPGEGVEPAEEWASTEPGRCGGAGGVGDTNKPGSQRWSEYAGEYASERPTWEASFTNCADGKARPVEPSIQPLAYGLSANLGWDRPGEDSPFRVIRDPKTGKSIGQSPWRVGMLRAYGNAIVPQVAAEFVAAFMEAKGEACLTTS